MKTLAEVTRARLRNEHLIGPPRASPEEVVGWLGAVQAQDYAGAKWAVGLRTEDCADVDVERAFRDGRILRTHVLRPTWHFVTPADIRWMLALTAPRIRAAMAAYERKLELTDRVRARSQATMAKALAGGKSLTRAEMGGVLARAGIEAAGLKLGLLLMRAEQDAVVCSGPPRGKQQTYALLDERAPATKPLDRDEALGALATRYFASHGPALPQDFAWWSGLTTVDAKAGIAFAGKHLEALSIESRTYWHAPGGPRPPKLEPTLIHLLPNYDEYLVAYKERSAVAEPASRRATAGAGDGGLFFASHFVVRAGLVVGGWRRLLEKQRLIVELRLRTALLPAERRALDGAARRLETFLALPVEVRLANTPGARLSKRPHSE